MTHRKRENVLRVSAWSLIALLACGCMQPGDERVGPEQSAAPQLGKADVAVECGGLDRAACVRGCGLEATGDTPQCRDGKWYCEDGIPDNVCPEFNKSCHLAQPCGHGYYCVKSMGHPVPSDAGICRKGSLSRDLDLEVCNSKGAMSPTEFAEQRWQLEGQVVKLTGMLEADIRCNDNPCFGNQCCNACAGNYVLDQVDPADPRRVMRVNLITEHLACNGNNCETGCGPWETGDTYIMWGVFTGCQGESNCNLYFMGGCPY